MPSKKSTENTRPLNYKGTLYRKIIYLNGSKIAVTAKSEKELNKKVLAKQMAIESGEYLLDKNTTVRHWAKQWLETYKAPSIGKGQLKNYTYHINGVIIPAIGNMKLSDVRDIDLQKILNNRADKSKSDLLKLRMLIKSIFRRARISRLIQYDPAEDLSLPIAEDGSDRSITIEERKAILKLAETHYSGLWIKTML